MESTPPADSSPEIKEADKPSAQGDNTETAPTVPYHQDPKVQDYISRQVENKVQETVRPLQTELETLKQQLPPSVVPIQMDDWFIDLAGNTPEAQIAWSKYQTKTQADKASWKAEFIAEVNSQATQAQQAQADAVQKVDNQIADLQAEGEKFDGNALKQWLLKYNEDYGSLPYNSDGSVDMRRGLKLWKAFNPTNSDKATARQQVAGLSTPDGTAERTTPKSTKKDLMSWRVSE